MASVATSSTPEEVVPLASSPQPSRSESAAQIVLRAKNAWMDRALKAEGLLREVAAAGVKFEDPRLDYLEVQIDCETWEALQSVPSSRSVKAPS